MGGCCGCPHAGNCDEQGEEDVKEPEIDEAGKDNEEKDE